MFTTLNVEIIYIKLKIHVQLDLRKTVTAMLMCPTPKIWLENVIVEINKKILRSGVFFSKKSLLHT